MDARDIIAIHQLMALYGHAADRVDDPSMLERVFTEDAVFDARPVDAGLHTGLAAIKAWFALGKPPHPPSHQTTNVYVYEEGGVVRVTSKWLTVNPETGRPRLGDYDDELDFDGQDWRIRRRVATGRYIERDHLGLLGDEVSR